MHSKLLENTPKKVQVTRNPENPVYLTNIYIKRVTDENIFKHSDNGPIGFKFGFRFTDLFQTGDYN